MTCMEPEKAVHLPFQDGRASPYPINVTCGGNTPIAIVISLAWGDIRLHPTVAAHSDAPICLYSMNLELLHLTGSLVDKGFVQKSKTES